MSHPDKEEIISKLLDGESVKTVESWLKDKYPRKKRYHISYMTLQKYRKDSLNVKGKMLEDIKNKRAELVKKQTQEDLVQESQYSNAYQNKLDEIVTKEIDVQRRNSRNG